jgi:small redox-active disulfide protein 2
MKIAVLGPGCTKCHKTYDHVVQAVKETGVEAEVIKVEKIDEMMAYGVMMTPAVVIDGEVKISGRVASVEQVKEWLGAS